MSARHVLRAPSTCLELRLSPGPQPAVLRRRRGRLDFVIDHVTIRVPGLERAWAFYGRALELLDAPEPAEGGGFDWGDFSLTEADDGEPITQRLHVAFYAMENRLVDDWWHAMTELGYRNDGEPGPRPQYGSEYYGAFVLDEAGTASRPSTTGAPPGRHSRPPLDPRPRPRSLDPLLRGRRPDRRLPGRALRGHKPGPRRRRQLRPPRGRADRQRPPRLRSG